jgi:ABC-type nickel/cobalt efflux system permease component RcnA
MTTTALIIIAVVIVVAIAAWLFFRQQRSKNLRYQFGPEYEHAVRKYGSSTKAEDALVARQKRIERFHIHSLQADERDRFAEQWHELQSRFVDDPSSSIESADQLVCEVMQARGYPMTEFERRAEDLSVDHPQVVRNYRAAHSMAVRRDRGEATTEDLRQALVFYRELFDELLEAHTAGRR